jgi:hypothetical protein
METVKDAGWSRVRDIERADSGQWDRFSAWLLICGAFGALMLTFAVILGQALDRAEDVAKARAPRLALQHPAEPVVGRWLVRRDAIGGRDFPVIFVAREREAAPPPGLSRWPEPGEFFVSPALAMADDSIASRYGKLAGVIAPQGLTDAGEWLVYLQSPRPMLGSRVNDVTGFGDPDPENIMTGTSREYRVPRWAPWLIGIAGFVAWPLLALGVGAADRLRRAGSALLSSMAGGAVGAAVAVAATGTVRLPWVGFALTASRTVDGATILAAAAAALSVWVAFLGGQRLAALRCAGPSWLSHVSGWDTAAVAIVLAIQAVLALSSRELWAVQVFDVLTWVLAVGLALLAGRLIAATAPDAVRVVLLASAMLVLGSILLPFQLAIAGTEWPKGRTAAEAMAQVGPILLVRPLNPVIADDATAFRNALPPEVPVLSVSLSGRRLQADCATLAAFYGSDRVCRMEVIDVHDPSVLVSVVRQSLFGGQAVQVGQPSTAQLSDVLVVLAERGRWAEVERAAYATLPAPVVDRPLEHWLVTQWLRSLPLGWAYTGGGLLLLCTVVAGSLMAYRRLTAAGSARRRAILTVAAVMISLQVGAVLSVCWIGRVRSLIRQADGPPVENLMTMTVFTALVTVGLCLGWCLLGRGRHKPS